MRKFENGSIKLWDVPLPKTDETHGQLASWLIEGPFHPFWNQWVMLLIHLHDIPGKEVHKKSPEMTHEMIIFSVDPKQPLKPKDLQKTEGISKHLLQPIDVIQQFHVDTDAQAIQLISLVAKIILAGQASPDQDYRNYWAKSISVTAEHIRDGHDCSKGKHTH